MDEWQSKLRTNFRLGKMILNTLMFADDQVIFTQSENKLQMAIQLLNKTTLNSNLETSINKSKVMAFKGKYLVRSKIMINNNIIEQVKNFNYLGCDIQYNYDADLQNKLHKFQYMCGTIKQTLINKTRKDTQLKFYKVMAVSVLYGCKNWALNREDRRKTETAEIKFLRRVAGYTFRDEVINTIIREELQIFNIGERIQSRKIEWHEHLSQMEQHRIAQVMFYKPIGYGDIGRPRRQWKDKF
jgi:hypothetical protein